MMRSLFSGVSGLKVHQTKMDVIGNNISNVNTVGFKGSNVTFSDVFYQTTQVAAGPNAQTGTAGRNAIQIGLGSALSSVTANITTPGGAQRTDNPFDVMINGDAFFIVNSGGTNYFTKAGAFNVDAAGNLCTPTGAYVMGWQVDNTGKNIAKDVVSPLKVMSSDKTYSEPQATTKAQFNGNIDAKDTDFGVGGTGMKSTLNFYDDLGNLYTAKYTTKQTENKNQYVVTLTDIVDATDTSIFAKQKADGTYEASGITEVTFAGVNYKVAANGIDPETGAVTLDNQDTGAGLAFNANNGKFIAVQDSKALPPATDTAPLDGKTAVTLSVKGAGFKDVSIDFSGMTNYASGGKSTMEPTKGDTLGVGAGMSVGEMIGISIDTSGKIFGTYDNGDKKLLGQIAVATFANPSGLEAMGDSLFAETMNSGSFDGIGKDPTSGGGSIQPGALEMSNVDLSSEFTTMITTQRGFQANSRIITTSDSMLEELINLKR